jgi:hypothetical protein
VEFFVIALFH